MLMASISESTAGENYVTNEELRAAFEDGHVDRILTSLNTVKQMRYKGEALDLLIKIWQRDYWSNAELLDYIASLPIVRMEVANVLLQANRNRLIEIDLDAVRTETLAHVDSQDVVLLGVVISNLSIINNEDDIELIKQIALRRNPSTFRRAVLALSTMCGEDADLALDSLVTTAISMGEHQHLADVRESMAEIRMVICGD